MLRERSGAGELGARSPHRTTPTADDPAGLSGPAMERRAWAWSGLALGGLALALAATLPVSEQSAGALVVAHLRAHLPDWVITTALTSLGTAAPLLIWLAVPRNWRRRKRNPELEIYHEPRKLPPSALVLLLVFMALPLVMIGGLIWLGGPEALVGPPEASTSVHPPEAPRAASVPSQPPGGTPVGKPRSAPPAVNGMLAALTLLIGVGSLALVLWIYFGGYLASWRLAGEAPAEFRKLSAAIDESLEDLQIEGDPRQAIIRCYQRFERTLAGAGEPRRAWQTPTEFMRSALRGLRLPDLAVFELTRLFELARFSHHVIDRAERDAALRHLAAIAEVLAKEEQHAPTA